MSEKWMNIPAEMRERRQWIAWRLEQRGDETTKIPIDAKSGFPASVNKPETWCGFERACKAGKELSGIGFVFTADDPYVGIDMDGHIDNELIEWLDSYTERSQSGNGAHIICRASVADGRRTSDRKFEIYGSGRYFVMTGDVLRDAPIAECTDKVANFYSFLFPKPKLEIKPEWIDHSNAYLDDNHDPIAFLSATVGGKFDRLWSGDASDYQGDESRADAALLSYLRFATGGNRDQSEALFRASGLMRKKYERKDYRDRTWGKIDNGDVYTPIARGVDAKPEVDISNLVRVAVRESSPWRTVTDAVARDAIKGSLIADMVSVFERVTEPKLPLCLTLPKAMVVAGCAVSCEAESGEGFAKYLTDDKDMSVKGVDRARLKINTGGGQVSNVYALHVAESGTGKDAGDLVKEIAMRNGWYLAGAGSAEGLADALSTKGKRNGIISISELSSWLDKHSWQSKAAAFLVEAYNCGYFTIALSKHKDKHGEIKDRSSPYCFPSVLASCQPAVFRKLASSLDMDTGFLSRFLVSSHTDENWCGWVVARMPKVEMICQLQRSVDVLRSASGVVEMKDRYQEELAAPFLSCNAPHRPHWRRLVSEYAPRLATMLAIQGPGTPVVDDTHMRRAGMVMLWYYNMAEGLFKDVRDTAKDNVANRMMQKVYMCIHKHGPMRKMNISQAIGGRKDERDSAIAELIDRGFIAVQKDKTIQVVNKEVLPADVSL